MKIVYLLLFTFFTGSFWAQTIEPSKATNKNIVSFETEFYYSRTDESGVTTKSWNVFNLLIRYGLTDSFELNAALSNAKEEIYQGANLEEHHHKFDVFKVGGLYNLNVFNNNKFEIALQSDLLVPVDKSHDNANKLGYIISVNPGVFLSDKWMLISNIGYLKDVDQTDKLLYKLNLQFYLNDKLLVFTEHTGNKNFNYDFTQSVGFGYYPSTWSFETVIGIGSKTPDFFTGFKIIKEFKLKKKAIN